MASRQEIADAFIKLGKTMEDFPEDVIWKASNANPWFTPESIRSAAGAIRGQMLNKHNLEQWVASYAYAAEPKDVVVIMAGNIPMAGFFDMLCIFFAGHRCVVKCSSKDSVLMEFVIDELKRLLPSMPVNNWDENKKPDAVIASGSDNTIRHLKSIYGNIPALYRGNRSSAAVIKGDETDAEMEKLAGDIFSYSSLGCRNVSHLLLPDGYDTKKLAAILSRYPQEKINPKYLNNFRQQKALLQVSGENFEAGKFFIMVESPEFPVALSIITHSFYSSPQDAARWVYGREEQIQCIVASSVWDEVLPLRSVSFGQAQEPTLWEFPDRRDTMKFLGSL